MKNVVDLLLVVTVGVLVRWVVGLHPHSGQGKPPMYGDYEAQRHWMEITTNLDIADWYRNTSHNDLLYWGLDYPPLTAYHSWACGKIAAWIDPSFVALKSSRGMETVKHKLFMRSTVLCGDLFLYIPAMMLFFLGDGHASSSDLLLAFLYPGLILVDYGHFQYNCVSLGLVLLAINCLRAKKICLGSVLFCLALNYKQMELYHALPFFFFILGLCWKRSFSYGLKLLVFVGVTVILTFVAVWVPFLRSFDTTMDVVARVFPFNRGLYEDKVANVWCSLSIIIKLKEYLSPEVLVKLCTAATAVSLVPSSLRLFLRPTFEYFCLSLMNSSLAFFLFSFHVHEKSILLAALPAMLLLPRYREACTWFLIVSCFSILPLMIKDDLCIAWTALIGVYGVLIWRQNLRAGMSLFFSSLFDVSVLGCLLLTVSSLFVKPPLRYPDLWPVLVSIYSCGHFCLFFLYFNYCQFQRPKFKNV